MPSDLVRQPVRLAWTTIFVSFFLKLGLLQGAFTSSPQSSHCFSGFNCVESINDEWCFDPASAGQNGATHCSGDLAEFEGVMQAHLAQRTYSIAYYGTQNNDQIPGGPDYQVPNGLNSSDALRLCLSGRAGDLTNVTICMNVTSNDEVTPSGFGSFCQVALAPDITKGCYANNFAVTSSDNANSSVSPTGSSSTNSQQIGPSVTGIAISNSPPAASQSLGISGPSNSDNDKNDPGVVKDIIIPVIVSVLGLTGTALGAGICIRRRKRRQQEQGQQTPTHQITIGPLHLHAHLGQDVLAKLSGSETSNSSVPSASIEEPGPTGIVENVETSASQPVSIPEGGEVVTNQSEIPTPQISAAQAPIAGPENAQTAQDGDVVTGQPGAIWTTTV